MFIYVYYELYEKSYVKRMQKKMDWFIAIMWNADVAKKTQELLQGDKKLSMLCI